MTIKTEQYLVDRRGHTKAVILSLTQYRNLVQHLNDLEDSLDLKHAVDTGRSLISHKAFISNLQKSGLL